MHEDKFWKTIKNPPQNQEPKPQRNQLLLAFSENLKEQKVGI